MQIAIISDIHSNLEALTAVLKKAKHIGYDELICLGDIIGYGPDPEPCLDIVFDNAKMIIKGNHEQAVAFPETLSRFNVYAKESLLWTIENISEKYFRFLTYLKIDYKKDNIRYVHGSPDNPESWNYISGYYDALKSFSVMEESLCFVGHSHIAGVYKERDSEIISKKSKTIINVGSVGQPRDGNNEASFGIFDLDRWNYTNYRVKYDMEKTREKILKNQLPVYLADRLLKGV
jgi:predicted phosphodiesterase